jgi:hypothetical protein
MHRQHVACRYPEKMMRSMVNAAVLAREIAVAAEHTKPSDEDVSSTWLIGRAEEISVFVSDVVKGWREDRVPLDRAAAVIDDYLESLACAFTNARARCV